MKIPLVDLKANYLSIKEEIDEAISKVIDETAFIGGKYLEQFEENFAKKVGSKYCVGCSSGTTAIQLALLTQGDHHIVLTVPNTFIATVEAIKSAGDWPVFCDVSDHNGLMRISSAIDETKRQGVRIILPVHLFGASVDVNAIVHNCSENKIIEDAAQAHFAKYNDGSFVGSKNLTCFSFFPGKNMGAFGDAGCITTNEKDEYEFMKAYRDHGRKSKFESDFMGNNFRMDAIQAAILNVKLNHIIEWNNKRKNAARLYDQKLSKIKNIRFLHNLPWEDSKYENQVFHLYVIRTDRRDDLKKYLESKGISCGIHYPLPIHKQKVYSVDGESLSFPTAETLSKEILSLPIYPEITSEQIEYVCYNISEFFFQ